ncbi:MAG: hypothetical protein IJU86_00765 [Firmicutes bacterium]|nr:hypothetical protein [Bacillota bacterium]
MESMIDIEKRDLVERFDADLKVLKDFFVGNSDGLRETVFKVSNENKLDMAKIIYSSDDEYKISNVDHDFCDPIRTFFTQQFPNIKSQKLQFENQLVNINNQLSQLSWWRFIKRFRLNKQKKQTLNSMNNYRSSYVNGFATLNDNFNSLNEYLSKNKNNKQENLPEEQRQNEINKTNNDTINLISKVVNKDKNMEMTDAKKHNEDYIEYLNRINNQLKEK